MGGLLTLAVGTGFLAWLAEPETEPVTLVPGLVVAGIGIGCVFAPLTAAATARLPGELIGAASGVFNTSRQVGGVLGSAAVGMLLQVGVAFAVPDAARRYAERLPPRYREEFVERITDAANTASQFDSTAPPVPSNLDPNVADIVRRIVTEVFHDGFTVAAKASLVLPIAVLVLGVLASAGIRVPRSARSGRKSARVCARAAGPRLAVPRPAPGSPRRRHRTRPVRLRGGRGRAGPVAAECVAGGAGRRARGGQGAHGRRGGRR